jgi:aspartyl-tRNA(Asn)/glutamyl-tRNA(Gln) amidotransferase subunit C
MTSMTSPATPTDRASLLTLCTLARLALGAEERERFAPELDRILAAFSVLAKARRTTATEPSGGAPPHSRADEPVPSLPVAELLAGAPASHDGYFEVPKTVGGER